MSTPSNAMYWSVRRELWENRSICLAPLIVTAVVVFGFLFSLGRLPRLIERAGRAGSASVDPFSMAAAPIMLTAFLVGALYAIDALYGERRDRSILFWKSLPVSDMTTVLSKISIPLVLLPAIAFVLSVVAWLTLVVLGSMVVAAHGLSPAPLWSSFFFEPAVMIYGLVVHTLWFAPIYAWLLLVSAWAKRTPTLWAVLPPLGVALLGRMITGTTGVCDMLGYRLNGAMKEAFSFRSGKPGHINSLSQLEPWNFLTTPSLWIGLVVAALFVAAAVRLRRSRGPV